MLPIILTLFFICCVPATGYCYIDPGTSGQVFGFLGYALAAIMLGLGIVLSYFRRFRKFVKSLFVSSSVKEAEADAARESEPGQDADKS